MANDDSKPKFLPRHLQRSQPAVAQKSKRRVTVEDENAGDEESDRRSVFERLGPGGSQRNEKKPCFEFQENGECQYGKACIYSHVVKEHCKSRDNDASPDNLKLKFKGGKDRENKVKSQVVVRGKAGGGSDDDTGDDSEDGWSMDKLEDKKELELEQKRLEIQRALEALEAVEEVPPNTRKSDSSSSDSSPERAHKKKKDKPSKKKEKKKHKKPLADKEQTVDKSKEGKRRHDSGDDDEDLVPHKKRKKKIKDKKHGDEPPLPAVVEPASNKHKKAQVTKGAKADLYDPESPTSIARDDTPIDKRLLSESPKTKGKGKKKKKKMKNQGDPPEKFKKLVSPLKKVLKLKRTSISKIASRRSRSASRDTHPRKHSRSRSSSKSSGSSSSHSPVRRRKGHDTGRDKSKMAVRPLDKKKRLKSRRTASSSSTTSSSSSSSSESRSRKRPRKASLSHDRSVSRTHKTRSPIASTVRKDLKGDKKKRGGSAETWVRTKDRGNEPKQRQSLDRGRDKDRGRKGDRVTANRRTLSQTVTKVVKVGRNDSRDGRKEVRDQKAGKAADSKDAVRRDNRDGVKPDRVEHRKEGQRERDSSRGDHRDATVKDREKRGMSQDRDDRLRRGTQQADRGSRFPQRSGEDGDRRHFDEPRGRFTGEGQRIGQFGGDRQRGGFDS
ncbi:unnamed protein product, partial [Lymnaea stagnalis]